MVPGTATAGDMGGVREVDIFGASPPPSSAHPGYDGAALARIGIVVVTANYRVGVQGYAQLDGAPPNRALLDQMAALRWVHDEIRTFGAIPPGYGFR
jgi:para-nitrobenzyl esterase